METSPKNSRPQTAKPPVSAIDPSVISLEQEQNDHVEMNLMGTIDEMNKSIIGADSNSESNGIYTGQSNTTVVSPRFQSSAQKVKEKMKSGDVSSKASKTTSAKN